VDTSKQFRPQFEDWAKGHGWSPVRKSTGQYSDARTRAAWAACCWMRYGNGREAAKWPTAT